MSESRPNVLSIAGFDPSGGAGILADIKTFEAHRVYGLAVCTALTFQNDSEFDSVKWIGTEDIIKQIGVLARTLEFSFVKIGLIRNLSTLAEVIKALKSLRSDMTIVWDPILKASAGFEFHAAIDREELNSACRTLSLITPNRKEISILVPGQTEEEGARQLSSLCPVLLKGGHSQTSEATDILYTNNEEYYFSGQRTLLDKHGTGCVLSSSVLALLALGEPLPAACEEAKNYTKRFIESDKSLLGYHYA